MEQMNTLARSVRRLERHNKDEYVFKATGVSKQAKSSRWRTGFMMS